MRKTHVSGLSWIALLHTLAFLLYWSTNQAFADEVNDFLAGMLGPQAPYLLIFMLLSAGLAAWTGWRLSRPAEPRRSWPYVILSILFLVFFYGSFAMLFQRAPEQPVRLAQLLGYFRILSDALLLLLAVWFLPHLLPARRPWRGLGLILILLAWIAPQVQPPANVFSSLPSKPLLIAHRGASMLAPENTLAAARRAAETGAYGLETDVLFSLDGMPYLMHDSTLARTTNVSSIFPGRENEPGSSFTWAELGQLNAGEWFVEQDPYGTIAAGLVTPDQAAQYRSEPIPSLADEIAFVRENRMVFIFDLRIPPVDHPYQAAAFDLALTTLADGGVAAQTWLLVGPTEIVPARALLPEAKLTAGIGSADPPEAQALLAQGYSIVNSEYSLPADVIRGYRDAGLWVNLWTVDEAWQYSRLWLLGVNSTTTNAAHEFQALKMPVFALPLRTYQFLWFGLGLVAVFLLAWRQRTAR